MSKQMKQILKSLVHQEFCQTRDKLHYTQAEMAERLQISLRSYADIDRGKNMCSGETLLLFLAYCCPDPNTFVDTIQKNLKNAED